MKMLQLVSLISFASILLDLCPALYAEKSGDAEKVILFSIGAGVASVKKTAKKERRPSAAELDISKDRDFTITSSMDGNEQPVYLIVPDNPKKEKRPLLVGLHSWGGTYMQKVGAYGPYGKAHGMYVVCPHYRGPNYSLKAAGSKYAVQDIVDVVEYMKKHYPIDEKRIYIVGASGGGHMALQMAAKHPEIWAAVSAWCAITDIAKWHKQAPKYRGKIEACFGGPPGTSAEMDEDYKYRSPIFTIAAAKNIPIQLVHGTEDKVVPVSQADEIVAVMKEAGFKKLEYSRRAIGHTMNVSEMVDFVRQFKKE